MYIDVFPFIVQHSAILRQQQTLITTNQSDFNIEAPPTWQGQIRKTCNMGEVTACICGITVAAVDRTTALLVAMQCGYLGCEVRWVCIPRGTQNVVNNPGLEFFFKVKKLTPPPQV